MTSKELSREWHEAIHAQYDPVLKASRRAGTYGGTLTARPTQREQAVNVSPSLSPDGTRVVYLSERGLLSVDLYLAEAETGRIIRKLVNTAVDPHLTSLQFIGSAGSWHPNGKQFVLGAIRDGQAELAVLDVNTGRTVQELPFPALGEILNPSWSPDGRSIAFSATSGGYSDLFIYDFDRGSLRQVTHDGFADLQPAWAPDGRRLAFVTDRFSTNLAVLHAGSYGLALLDPATDRIEPLPTFDRGKSINPQWSPDGRHLYFLSDRTGLTNIYVMDVTTRQVRQVTDLDAGASGITALSPALSSPLDANRLAFSAYDDGQFGIYTVDEPAVLSGVPVTSPRFGTSAAALSPEQRASGTLTNLLGDPTTGLPPGAGGIEPYRPRLSLDFVGQPYVSVGVDRFGTSYGGGLSFLWSDMLGNHNLMATIDANTDGTGFSSLLKNTGGLLAYQNLTRRWNWGVAVQQSPYLARIHGCCRCSLGIRSSCAATVSGRSARASARRVPPGPARSSIACSDRGCSWGIWNSGSRSCGRSECDRGCTVHCRPRWACSRIAESRGIAALAVRRRSPGCVECRRDLPDKPAELRDRADRSRPSIPAARPRLDLDVQPDAGVLTTQATTRTSAT